MGGPEHERPRDAERRLTYEQERERMDLAEISHAMGRLYEEMSGRSPTRVRSALAGTDCLVCTVEESLTPAERNMVSADERQRLRDLRLSFQQASKGDFIRAVEGITRRKVRAFVSGMDVGEDVAADLFYFEPIGTPFGHADRRAQELRP